MITCLVPPAALAFVLLLGACQAPQPPEPQPSSVTASAQQPDLAVSIYFTRDEAPHAVQRTITAEADTINATLEQLLRGPTAEERAAGISSWFSEDTAGMLRRADIDEEGHAVIDFGDFRRIISGASSSAGSRILLNEITATVAQFEIVRSIEYQLEGSCHRFWTFMQRACEIIDLGPNRTEPFL